MTKVYPTKATALNVHHPIAGAPRVEGVEWPHDTFTCRRLSDGSFTEDPTKAYKPGAPDPVASKPVPVSEGAKSQDSFADGKSK